MYGVETCDSHNVKVKVIFTIVEMLFGALRAVSTVGARAFSSAPPSVCLVLQWLLWCNIKYVTLFWIGNSFQVWALGRLNHVAIAVPDLQVVGTSRQAFFNCCVCTAQYYDFDDDDDDDDVKLTSLST